jgi:hypothetical protein
MRDGSRGSTRDKALAKAVAEVQPYFHQCHRCGQWVCDKVCWNAGAGLCAGCAPKMDQEVAGLQAAAQVQQVREKIAQQDWTKDVSYTDRAVGICPSCHAESGGGKFCQNCGQPLAAAPWPKRFCTNCGAQLANSNFCGQCGSPADAPFPA